MKEDFKKWLCEKAKEKSIDWINVIPIEIMIKAVWEINKNNNFGVIEILIWGCNVRYQGNNKNFHKANYNNSEQQALEAALEYIYNQSKNTD